MNFELLATENLILRKTTPEVYAFVFTNYDSSELKTFFGFATEEELEKEKEKFRKGLVQKLNFTKEGYLRKHYCKNNVYGRFGCVFLPL